MMKIIAIICFLLSMLFFKSGYDVVEESKAAGDYSSAVFVGAYLIPVLLLLPGLFLLRSIYKKHKVASQSGKPTTQSRTEVLSGLKSENNTEIKRIPLYLLTSTICVTISIIVATVLVIWSGSQLKGFIELHDQVNVVGEYMTELWIFFFIVLWFIAPIVPSYIAIKSSTAFLDFNDRRYRLIYRIFTLTLVLIAVWFLVPLIMEYPPGKPSGVVLFRTIDIVANILIAAVLITKSYRK